MEQLNELTAGMAMLVGGDHIVRVSPDLAAAFAPGDRLLADSHGELLHIPSSDQRLVEAAVSSAHNAFGQLGGISDDTISAFYEAFAAHLSDDDVIAPIVAANDRDVAAARAKGRSTTRLTLSPTMRADMIAGLHTWRQAASTRDSVIETVQHDGWTVEQRRAPLGVVGFVFEGRPNVFADATGVLRSGNTVVFRIGSDALDTARAIMRHAVVPALAQAGLPRHCVGLLDSPSRATGWALFSHPQLSLAVARGSGSAVAQLGSVARQAGVPVSLHGTGGAWMVAGEHVDPERFSACVRHSLDRKVCNTLNVCVILRAHTSTLVPRFLEALDAASATRGAAGRLHVVEGGEQYVPASRFESQIVISRAEGDVVESAASSVAESTLGTEWEWEGSPEVTLAVVDSLDQAIDLCNTWSPGLVASLISDDPAEQERFWAGVDSPFIGDGFTRWVDGQFALGRPELGLSNWENGRLFARGPVLSGDSVFTVRVRAQQSNPDLHR